MSLSNLIGDVLLMTSHTRLFARWVLKREQNVTKVGGPQCYRHVLPPAIPTTVTFSTSTLLFTTVAGNADADAGGGGGVDVDVGKASTALCWTVINMFGEQLPDPDGRVCADASGKVELRIPVLAGMEATENSPVYLLPTIDSEH